jgi:hypothetical protein
VTTACFPTFEIALIHQGLNERGGQAQHSGSLSSAQKFGDEWFSIDDAVHFDSGR